MSVHDKMMTEIRNPKKNSRDRDKINVYMNFHLKDSLEINVAEELIEE